MSYMDTVLLKVPPYQVVSRLMVTIIFIVTGTLIAVFMYKRKKMEAEKIRLEKQLQQSQKLETIGTLAGGIAHDFNNILYGTIGYTELCLDDAKPGTALHDNIKEILAGGKRAKALVKQILTFSRQTDKKIRPIQIDSIVKEVCKLLRSTIPTTIKIDLDIRTHTSTILGDPTQIHQVLMNLAINALHAMEEKGGTLNFTALNVETNLNNKTTPPTYSDTSKAYLKLSVSDTGTGIAGEIQNRIFDPFFTTKEQGKGTGMGLSVVHGVVQAHDGHIEIASTSAYGTIFDIYLPIIDSEETSLDISCFNGQGEHQSCVSQPN